MERETGAGRPAEQKLAYEPPAIAWEEPFDPVAGSCTPYTPEFCGAEGDGA